MPRLLNASSHLTGPTLNRQLLYKEPNSHQELQSTQRKWKRKITPERQAPSLNSLSYINNHLASTEPTTKRKGISWPQCHSETQEGPRHLDTAGWLDNSKRQIPEHNIPVWMTKLIPIYISRKWFANPQSKRHGIAFTCLWNTDLHLRVLQNIIINQACDKVTLLFKTSPLSLSSFHSLPSSDRRGQASNSPHFISYWPLKAKGWTSCS